MLLNRTCSDCGRTCWGTAEQEVEVADAEAYTYIERWDCPECGNGYAAGGPTPFATEEVRWMPAADEFTLGELRRALNEVPHDGWNVEIVDYSFDGTELPAPGVEDDSVDFTGMGVDGLLAHPSYRGLGLVVSPHVFRVADELAELDEVYGKTYIGALGDLFEVTNQTNIWVQSSNKSTSKAVVEVNFDVERETVLICVDMLETDPVPGAHLSEMVWFNPETKTIYGTLPLAPTLRPVGVPPKALLISRAEANRIRFLGIS